MATPVTREITCGLCEKTWTASIVIAHTKDNDGVHICHACYKKYVLCLLASALNGDNEAETLLLDLEKTQPQN